MSQKNYLPVLKNQQKTLKCNQAAIILRNFNPTTINTLKKYINLSEVKFFIFNTNDSNEASDYKCDGYTTLYN